MIWNIWIQGCLTVKRLCVSEKSHAGQFCQNLAASVAACISLSRSRARETVEVRGRASAQGSKSCLPQGKIDHLLLLTMDHAESPRCIIADPTLEAQNANSAASFPDQRKRFSNVLHGISFAAWMRPAGDFLTQAEKYCRGKEPRRRSCSVKPRGGGLSPSSVQSVCLVRNVPFWALRKGRTQRYERKFKAHPNVIAQDTQWMAH
jgi:hypothetical protein